MERGRVRDQLNPDGNERLTATVGLVLVVLTLIELATLVLGLGQLLSVHVFIGLVLIPPILLKLASTGWRFTRYYTRSEAYRLKGAPQIAMRMLAPLLVAATVVLFASGVAIGLLHGHALSIARQLHGPASVVWMIVVGLHVLVYLRRALLRAKEDVTASTRASVRGAKARLYLLAGAIVAGIVVGVATLPAEHRWLHLPDNHGGRDGSAALIARGHRSALPA
jgi:hypothetical protein